MTQKLPKRGKGVVLAAVDGKANDSFKNGPIPGGSDAEILYFRGELLKIEGRKTAIRIAEKKLKAQMKISGVMVGTFVKSFKTANAQVASEIIESNLKTELRYLRLQGVAIGTQTDIFDDVLKSPPINHPRLKEKIALDGYRAGMGDEPPKSNPHVDNPPLSQQWMEGYHIGQADRKAIQEDVRGRKADQDNEALA
jgi:hypothetical protein